MDNKNKLIVSESIINIITIILVCISIILISPCFFSKKIERFWMTKPSQIPNTIIQTYYNKKVIPHKVYENIKKFGKGYQHLVFDDNECIEFLKKEYGDIMVNKFRNLKKGAHKSDLFRYCYLYKYGGVYLDIKTELIKNLNSILRGDFTFTVISFIPHTPNIYQGVLATRPRNPLFFQLITNMLSNKNPKYMDFTVYFYKLLSSKIKKKPVPGVNRISENDFVYLFQENCTSTPSDVSKKCHDGKDRYGLCCLIYDNNEPIIKTRYSDFPWKA